ncbi:MAG: alpha/beta hydrolase [Pseudomonadota bacterium]
MKKRHLLFLFLLALLAALYVSLTPDSDPQAMRAKYASSESRFLSLEPGLTLHYRDEGIANGPVLVLLHGNSASLHSFDPLVERLKDRFRLIRYDHPGHGLTGPNATQTYAYADFERAFSGLLAELNVDQFHLLGHSMGGWVAWRYAAANPQRIKRLVLMSASGMPLGDAAKKVDNGLGFKIARSAAGRWISKHITPRSLVRDSVAASVADQALVTDEWADRYYELLLMPGNREALGARMIAQREPELADTVARVNVPSLLLWGEHDNFVPASAAAEFAQRMPSTSTVILEGIGHMLVEEAPDDVARIVSEFLSVSTLDDTALD